MQISKWDTWLHTLIGNGTRSNQHFHEFSTLNVLYVSTIGQASGKKDKTWDEFTTLEVAA
jgi:hypothetical protein